MSTNFQQISKKIFQKSVAEDFTLQKIILMAKSYFSGLPGKYGI